MWDLGTRWISLYGFIGYKLDFPTEIAAHLVTLPSCLS